MIAPFDTVQSELLKAPLDAQYINKMQGIHKLSCRVALTREPATEHARLSFGFIFTEYEVEEFAYFTKICGPKRFMNLKEMTRESLPLQSSHDCYKDVIDNGEKSVDMWSSLGSYQKLRKSSV